MDKNFEIKEKIGVIKEDASGDTLELNIVAWYGGYAKFDIRRWSPDHERSYKGMTLTQEEAENLSKLLNEYFQQKHDLFAYNIAK